MILNKMVRLSKKGQFVIPKTIREALGVKEGDKLIITFDQGQAIITRPEHYARSTRGLLKGTWGRTKREVVEYMDKERRSWE